MQSSIPSGESFVIVDIDCQIAASLLLLGNINLWIQFIYYVSILVNSKTWTFQEIL